MGAETIAKAAPSVLGDIAGFLPGVGAIFNGIMTWYGIDKQLDDNRANREQNMRLFERAEAGEESRFARSLELSQEQLGLTAKAQRFGQKLAKQKMGMLKDQDRYSKMLDNTTRFVTFLNSRPQIAASFAEMYRR
jgi:hypothetical protein